MPAHTHDGVDWAARLADLRQADAANAVALRAVADRLIESVPAPLPTVIDVGSGAGGMSAALAAALVGRAARATTGTTDVVAAPSHAAQSHAADPADQPAAPSAGVTAGATRDVAADFAGVAASRSPAAGTSTRDVAADLRGVAAVRTSAAGTPTRGSGALILVDMVPELLAAAREAAVTAVGGSGAVDVHTVQGDVADPASFAGLPPADLVWASNVVHHLPDQRAAVLTLAGLLAPGGCLALAEGGLSMRCLPWDVGVGEPGLQDRLIAAHGTWFHRMRTEMPDAVRLPVGWNQVLTDAGLSGVTAFSYLVDVPAPLSADGRGAVVSWLTWMSHAAEDLLGPADTAVLRRLVDPNDPAYVARRDDIFMLKASTVYLGWR